MQPNGQSTLRTSAQNDQVLSMQHASRIFSLKRLTLFPTLTTRSNTTNYSSSKSLGNNKDASKSAEHIGNLCPEWSNFGNAACFKDILIKTTCSFSHFDPSIGYNEFFCFVKCKRMGRTHWEHLHKMIKFWQCSLHPGYPNLLSFPL